MPGGGGLYKVCTPGVWNLGSHLRVLINTGSFGECQRKADSFIILMERYRFFPCGSSRFLLVIKRGFFLIAGQESINLCIEELQINEKLE